MEMVFQPGWFPSTAADCSTGTACRSAPGATCWTFWWPHGRRVNIQTAPGTFLGLANGKASKLVSNMPYMHVPVGNRQHQNEGAPWAP